MKVIHIESGLGNQMLSYCELLALRQANPAEKFYLETLVYDMPECNEAICQWNGYELERIFHIKEPNISEIFSKEEWVEIKQDIYSTKFWEHNWNWPVLFQKVFAQHRLVFKNDVGDFEAPGAPLKTSIGQPQLSLKSILRQCDIYKYLKSKKDFRKNSQRASSYSNESIHFKTTPEDLLTGQRLTFKYVGSGIERIETEVRKIFSFDEFADEKNKTTYKEIQACNAVAIHARRGDMFGYNNDCYKFGYFQRCIKYIRSQVPSPVFYVFCDPDSVKWAKDNAEILGLNMKSDIVRFVDWNKDLDSYRDMQLMAACKHQVITRSSFGWWGAWLNTYPEKITCSPDPLINTTHHF